MIYLKLLLYSLDHHKCVHNFFWRNKLDMKKRDKYKLSQGKLDEFKDVFEKAVHRYHEETQQAVREVKVTNLSYLFFNFVKNFSKEKKNVKVKL